MSSWLLDARTGWRTSERAGAAVGAVLSLAAEPAGPHGLLAPDGSLGGLVLPKGVAVDRDAVVYRIEGDRVRRLDQVSGSSRLLPAIGGRGPGVRRLRRPRGLAVARGNLYVADTGHARVPVFALDGLALRETWQRRWRPVDVAAYAGHVYVLDQRHGRVYRDDEPLVEEPSAAGRWTRLAVDLSGRIHLLDRHSGLLDVYGPDGRPLGHLPDADSARDRFAAPPAVPSTGTGPPTQAYARRGTWTGAALDSELSQCQWHRIELRLRALPSGTSLRVLTYTAEQPTPVPEELWDLAHEETGSMRARPPDGTLEFLVRSGPGRHLSIRLVLTGDGQRTPEVESVRVHYPRASYLSYLPAVYSAQDESRSFLERFLSVFQTEWDALEESARTSARLFDPAAVPDDALDYLASWLGVLPEGTWSPRQNRRLLGSERLVAPVRGTVRGLRTRLRVCLRNLVDLPKADLEAYPAVVESFRTRDHLLLADEATRGAPLWSRSTVGRLRLGDHSTADEARLVSVGDPELDVFGEYAHRFTVFVPASFVRTEQAERLLRRVVEQEKPAHTDYRLCLAEARLRVGVQSVVGVDSIVAALPAPRLAHARLGLDTVLTGGSAPPAAVGRSTKVR